MNAAFSNRFEPRAEHGIVDSEILDQDSFRRMIAVERRRSERSRNPVVLMLLDAGNAPIEQGGKVLTRLLSALSLAARDTDVTGWYIRDSVVGVLFTEINIDDHGEILTVMMSRVSQTLKNNLELEKFGQVGISFHVFPEDWKTSTLPGSAALYPDLVHREREQKFALAVKRSIDICGSLLALLLLAPVFAVVSAAVKLSSKGPVLYKQERIGRFGRPFTFLKFRSMYANNDPKIHREFMKRVISGEHEGEANQESNDKVYKMTNDPRITRVGRILRRASLDELPQFLNVLRGDMSLVGPRPPLAYECAEYDVWHRRRVLEARPGLTGLWQVMGRSRVSFDDMVRLDLQYVRTWSLWLDIKILLKTPVAVLRGGDAF